MKNKMFGLIFALFLLTISISLASALTVTNVDSPVFKPGQEGSIRIIVENNLDTTAKDISISLDLTNLPFVPVGSSEESIDEIKKDKDELFEFEIKAANDIEPGDYEISYELSYETSDSIRQKRGTIGVNVGANAELTYSATTEMPVIGSQGKISLKIVNKGFGDAKFVSIKVSSTNSFTLLSDEEVYIGTIDSDDFETANFDVIFNTKNILLNAIVEYKDFDNREKVDSISLPLNIYTRERAIELGIIKKSNASTYTIVVIVIILIWIIWRKIKKRRRLKRSKQLQNQGR